MDAKTGSGMTPGHLPVRSYLAVSVVSRSGEVIGGLSFGHPETGVFSERVERIIVAIAAQAAVGIDNARLYDAPAAPLGNGKICSRPSARSARLAAAAKGNGSVRVTSPGEGQGATFTVQLPVLLLHPIAGEPSDPSREPSSPPSRFASLDLTGVQVLVVDD